ncbi:MAG TPA: nucleoside deaminase [Salinimicrobium sp.]|nr:nucleoside deaminase [Salinimicrobium sp.]
MLQPVFDDQYFMNKALDEAKMAYSKGEVPVGAVIVIEEQIIARGHNLTELLTDVTAHAEMQAITSAANFIGGKYLTGCTMYVTLEPCQMCAGALAWSQISVLVFGADDPKRGYRACQGKLHPKTKVRSGILGEQSRELINNFFNGLRK